MHQFVLHVIFWESAALWLWPPRRCSCKSLTWFNEHGLWNDILSHWCQHKAVRKNAVLQIISQSSSCNLMLRIRRLLLLLQNATCTSIQLCSTLYTEGEPGPRKLVGLYFFKLNPHFIFIQFDTSELSGIWFKPIFARHWKPKVSKSKLFPSQSSNPERWVNHLIYVNGTQVRARYVAWLDHWAWSPASRNKQPKKRHNGNIIKMLLKKTHTHKTREKYFL